MMGDNLLSLPIFAPPPPHLLSHRLPWDIAPRAPLSVCKHGRTRGPELHTLVHKQMRQACISKYAKRYIYMLALPRFALSDLKKAQNSPESLGVHCFAVVE